MSEYTFAFITPSYAPDFQRCKLLCWSIKKFVVFPIKHYIIVDKRDLALFQELTDSNTIILTKEEILPDWFQRTPFGSKKNLWLNLKGFKSGNWLLRGWLVQQIIKLAAAQYAKEDILVFVDSDVAFVDFFDIHSLVHNGKVRLFRVEHSTNMETAISQKWKDAAKNLLGLPPDSSYYDFYIHQIVSWKRDNLLQLYKLIERNFSQDWLEVIAGAKDLSEYILYGLFVNYVMAEQAGHYYDYQQKICWCYWEDTPMSDEDLKRFFQDAQSSEHKAVMISAKASVDLSIEMFQKYLAPSPKSLTVESA